MDPVFHGQSFQPDNAAAVLHQPVEQNVVEVVPLSSVDEPITFSSLCIKISAFQEQVDAAKGDLVKIEQLTAQTLKCLEEEGAIVTKQNPDYEPFIKYLKFIVDFYAADSLIEERLYRVSDQPYSNAEKDEFRRILDTLLRAEPHLLIPAEAFEKIGARFTYNFNSMWHHAMKVFCMIVINNPAPAMNVLCGCCSGYVLIQDLLEKLDVISSPDYMNVSQEIRENTRQRFGLIASIAEKGRHQGPCFVPPSAFA